MPRAVKRGSRPGAGRDRRAGRRPALSVEVALGREVAAGELLFVFDAAVERGRREEGGGPASGGSKRLGACAERAAGLAALADARRDSASAHAEAAARCAPRPRRPGWPARRAAATASCTAGACCRSRVAARRSRRRAARGRGRGGRRGALAAGGAGRGDGRRPPRRALAAGRRDRRNRGGGCPRRLPRHRRLAAEEAGAGYVRARSPAPSPSWPRSRRATVGGAGRGAGVAVRAPLSELRVVAAFAPAESFRPDQRPASSARIRLPVFLARIRQPAGAGRPGLGRAARRPGVGSTSTPTSPPAA